MYKNLIYTVYSIQNRYNQFIAMSSCETFFYKLDLIYSLYGTRVFVWQIYMSSEVSEVSSPADH